MKILHTVEFYHPSVGGAQEVVKQLSEHMVTAGHDVTVATTKLPERKENSINGVKIEEFDIAGNEVRGYTGEVERYKDFLRNGDFDVVMNYACQQWATDLFFGVIDEVKAKKVLVPCGYSALYDPAYRNYFARLPKILEKYDATVYLSETYRDIEFARKHGAGNTRIIPNGADEKEFQDISEDVRKAFRQKHGVNNLLIITIGNHTAEKGHTESLLAFFLAPIFNATFIIIGRSYPGAGCFTRCQKQANFINKFSWLTGKRVLLLELPREETVSALKGADIFIFLSNIEASPLVLFEAAAAGLPFLASEAGNSAEIATWTKGGITIKSHQRENGRVRASILAAVAVLTRLAYSPGLRERFSRRGRRSWEERFTWVKIAQQYLELYREVRVK